MPDALALEVAQVRLSVAQAALATARARLETLPDDSDEALSAACELIPLKRARSRAPLAENSGTQK
jgi:hypothetical protein